MLIRRASQTPFLSLTLTSEGASLIADIRLLRALFEGEDESIVYATGQGGLAGVWGGEEEDSLEAGQDTNTHLSDDARPAPPGSSDDEVGQLAFDDSEEWEAVPPHAAATRSARMQAHGAERVGEGEEEEDQYEGRHLFKCLQLDLSSFGLEKAGLAHQFSGLLTSERINLMYSSTFR